MDVLLTIDRKDCQIQKLMVGHDGAGSRTFLNGIGRNQNSCETFRRLNMFEERRSKGLTQPAGG